MARTRQSYKMKQFQDINQKLLDLPAKPKEEKAVSVNDGAAAFKEGIRAAIKNGYSVEEVHTMINESGIPISLAMVKKYASTMEGKRKSSKPVTNATAERPASSSVKGAQS